jgi:Fe-S cluster biosynthesis and repair protein YggX
MSRSKCRFNSQFPNSQCPTSNLQPLTSLFAWYHPPMAERKVFCEKFQKELPGLDSPPWPGELGQRIYEHISADAWKLWEERMKMILNEYRLMPWQKEAQELVAKHMEDFFFGEGAALPPGYVPQQGKQ